MVPESPAPTKIETPLRFIGKPVASSRFGSARRAIRRNCRDCSNDSPTLIRECPCVDCALWPFRFGVKPETAERRGEVVDPARARAAGWIDDPAEATRKLTKAGGPNEQ